MGFVCYYEWKERMIPNDHFLPVIYLLVGVSVVADAVGWTQVILVLLTLIMLCNVTKMLASPSPGQAVPPPLPTLAASS